MLTINRQVFFTEYKRKFGPILPSTVDDMRALLTAIETQTIISYIPEIAYIFATIAHQTDWTWKLDTDLDTLINSIVHPDEGYRLGDFIIPAIHHVNYVDARLAVTGGWDHALKIGLAAEAFAKVLDASAVY